MHRLTLRRPRGIYLPSLQRPCFPDPPTGATKPVRASGPLDPITLPKTKTARGGLRTMHAMLNASWPVLLASPSTLPRTSPTSRPGHAADARSCRRVTLPTSRDAFQGRTPTTRRYHPRQIITCFVRVKLTHLTCHLMDVCLVYREVAEVAPHHGHRDLARAIWRSFVHRSLCAFRSRIAWFKRVCGTRGTP